MNYTLTKDDSADQRLEQTIVALDATDGNALRAAELLGISHRQLMRDVAGSLRLRAQIERLREERGREPLEALLLALPPGTTLELRCPEEDGGGGSRWRCSITVPGRKLVTRLAPSPARAIMTALQSMHS